ncbi:hypothetical protein PRIPAC_95143 [Pristionchus pacificus]|uniref:Uncharacterized protein n=1 Tax=Pristionchus pacificus TaxID=54126 RepID=A0A2A6BXS3_PRIPA|nr:hypothetical protein PRIPAC_95143 [Pristionchus pacificus]|eukprot:PDM70705.1 hypothetical protein PRIPAC_43910 [Pristionchus pacificus]
MRSSNIPDIYSVVTSLLHTVKREENEPSTGKSGKIRGKPAPVGKRARDVGRYQAKENIDEQ